MTRPLRTTLPGIPHHVIHRGNRNQQTFFIDEDFRTYMQLLAGSGRTYGVEFWAYCLMPNHVHLIAVPDTEQSLSFAIGEAHRSYAQKINYRYGWKGCLWQARFRSFPMDERYLHAVGRYVELNPVRAGICASPFDYLWSSSNAHLAGTDDALVKVAPLLARFPDWPDYLRVENTNRDIELIRKHARIGRPLGSENSLRDWEQITGRPLIPRRPGPKSQRGESN